MRNYKQTKIKQSGTILLLSLFILSGILMATTIIANIIIREIRLGKDYQNALISLLGSESFIEEALYMLRIEQKTANDLNASGTLANGVVWNRTAYDKTDQVIYDFLEKNDRVIINLYNKSNPGSSAGAESLQINWKTGAFLDVSILEWDGVTLSSITPVPQTYPCASSPCNPAIITALTADKAYQVVITAKTGDASDLIITAHSSDVVSNGNKVFVEGPIIVNSTARLGDARQAIQVSIAQRLPWQ